MPASAATVAHRLPRGWAHLGLQFAFLISGTVVVELITVGELAGLPKSDAAVYAVTRMQPTPQDREQSKARSEA